MTKQPKLTQRPCDCTVHCGDDRRDIEAGIAIPCEAYRLRQQEALAADARAARLADLIAQGSHKADIDLLDALEELKATKAELTACAAAKDGAYLERNQVVAALAKCFPSGTAQTPIEGWDQEWFGCVYIDLPTGQSSWHFHSSQAYLFAALPPYAGEWDGHSTAVKYERLAGMARVAHQQADPLPVHADHVPEIAARLRRLAKACSAADYVPADDRVAVGAIFSVLGGIAHTMELTAKVKQANSLSPDQIRREALLNAICRLNQSPYSLTKSECIHELQAMRNSLEGAAG